jgi:hypothetical protein
VTALALAADRDIYLAAAGPVQHGAEIVTACEAAAASMGVRDIPPAFWLTIAEAACIIPARPDQARGAVRAWAAMPGRQRWVVVAALLYSAERAR